MKMFKQRLQMLIDSKNLTQREVAEALEINEARVSEWLSGKVESPRRTSIKNIAKMFSCDFEWLAHGIGEPFPAGFKSTDYGQLGRITSGMPPKSEKVVMTIEPGPARKKGSKIEEQQARQETESINEEEAIEQTRYILRSDTVYRGALHSNIRAFYQGVKREEEMAGVDEQMIEMQNKMDMMMQMLESLGAHLPGKKRDAQEG